MNERPIIFNSEMVRAILEGRKTQTRRIIKPQPTVTEERLRELGAWIDGESLSEQLNNAYQNGFVDVKCPLGRVGDRLWVRESWGNAWHHAQPRFFYRATDEERIGRHPDFDGWKPSIHMLRLASRIALEITDVRVERLQDITEDDAKAEGALPLVEEDGSITCGRRKTVFHKIMESMHGKGSWDKNPFVWVISFRRIN